MKLTIALVTSVAGRDHDDDLPPLIRSLESRGIAVVTPNWDDESFDWSTVDLAVIRSTWDYIGRRDEFVAWAARCGDATTLVNDCAVIEWNSDKRYLDELVAAGISVVDTEFVVPGDDVAALQLPVDIEFVVKPTVSAGSKDTVRYAVGDHDRARVQISELLAVGRPTMIQPYQASVDAEGESALLFFGGEFSHAIRKGPLLVTGEAPTDHLFAPEKITRTTAEAGQIELAKRCLAALGELDALSEVRFPLAYARVDVLLDNDGDFSILELELVEPSLFLDWETGPEDSVHADRYCDVLVSLAGGND